MCAPVDSSSNEIPKINQRSNDSFRGSALLGISPFWAETDFVA
jgi:hypothetical protein